MLINRFVAPNCERDKQIGGNDIDQIEENNKK